MCRLNTLVVILVSLFVPVSSYAQAVIINEVLHDAIGTDTGKEWIELLNPTGVPISLDGYLLCARASGGTYTFASFTLGAHSYVVVNWNSDGTNTSSVLYTGDAGFDNISDGDGSISVFRTTPYNSGNIVDFVQWGAGGQTFEGYAVSAGIWTAGDYVPKVEAGHSMEYDGSGDSSTDWFNQPSPTAGGDNSLPVELSSFIARVDGLAARLEWTTYSEISNHGFIILRAAKEDGVYQDISGLIQGAGTSSDKHEYTYRDERVEVGKSYWYQLKQIDYDGAFEIHGPIMVTISAGESLNDASLPAECCLLGNYPNPFNAGTKIVLMVGANEADVEVEIFDLLGRKVRTLVSGDLASGKKEYLWSGVNDQGEPLPTGVYFCNMTSAQGGASSIKLIKMN